MVKDGGGGSAAKDRAPFLGGKVCGYKSRKQLTAFGNDLEDTIGILFCMERIAEFINAQDSHLCIVIDLRGCSEGLFNPGDNSTPTICSC